MENKNIQNEIESLKQEIKKQNRALAHLIAGGVCFISAVIVLTKDATSFDFFIGVTAILIGTRQLYKGLKGLK